jgi:hypothetical protein
MIVMFHDPELSRTTDGRGRIEHQDWVDGLECVVTFLPTLQRSRCADTFARSKRPISRSRCSQT